MKLINEKSLSRFASSGAPADKEGYLNKKGEVNKGFQRRYFVLKGNLLFYYEKKGDREPLGVVVLEGCTIELCENSENFSFQIIYQGQNSRVYVLSAESQELMESWMKALSCAGYEYVKLMVADLQSQLNELSASEKRVAVANADRDSHIFQQAYAERSPPPPSPPSEGGETSGTKYSPIPHQRVNPFNNRSSSSSSSNLDYFNQCNARSSADMSDNVFTSRQCKSFQELHDEVGRQIKQLQDEWWKQRLQELKDVAL